MTKPQVKLWVCPAWRLRDLDPIRARDLVVDCFYHAQGETFRHQKERMGVPADKDSLRRTVIGAVRAAFDKTGGDFEHPTAESLRRAVQALGASAASWGTPKEIIEHHQSQIEEMLARLPE